METILITGAGAPGITGTIYSLRNNPDNTQFRIVSTDIQNNPVGKYLSDAFYRLPAPEHESYLGELRKIVESEKVQVIIPQTTRVIEVLSQAKDQVELWGVKLVLSDAEAIHHANDKYLILKECEKNGVPVPEHFLVDSKTKLHESILKLGYPEKKVVVKPRLSNGQRGVKIITNEGLTLNAYLNEKPSSMETDLDGFLSIFDNSVTFPELIVSEYMPGIEYTVDVFKTDNVEVIIPRTRDVIRSGISFQTTIDMKREDIVDYSKKLSNSMNLKFCFGFQFKLDANGVPKILESNPRVQGTMVASTMANFNMIYYSVLSCLNRLELTTIDIKDKTCFKRSWGGIGIDEQGNETGRI